jgi:hypothetical protein
MRGPSRAGAALIAALVLVVAGGSYAFGASQSSTISVCVHHKGGALYQASKCARRDKRLSWNSQGPQGVPGAQGVAGIQGPKGATGVQGPAGPTTTIAPSGITQIGVINAAGEATAAGQYVASQAVSFPLQLASAPTVVQVPWGSSNAHCPGTTAAPAANPGYLCIFIRGDSNVAQAIAGNDFYPQEPGNLNYGAGSFGVLLTAESNASGVVEVVGSWAVTAP